ncbi:cobalt/nickel transport system permease protein [Clostridium pascui]|uniref:energy-coupling factor ABC transporter permease n=1 Tax=Clostridium pascui TaxID=46609 RepID=UPI00195DE2B3|nr:energy-coupling factor ABC transporter permease [Clostridium pascui]MBM7871343.1 cobalt/nickel transport system permease protein [Clostridium pascui]
MHMADALISPIVGGTMFSVTASITTYSVKKMQNELDDKKIPLMGVMGAFVFAAQMINFSIPGTGSSGHIGGGLLLAILLGPYAGFLTMASVLLIQALFFADGGLLAFGANVFNLGFYTCFIAYPLIYKGIMKKDYSSKKIFSASIIASIIGLQMGAFSVVLETLFSGKTELPFANFVILMQPIHLVIGIVEGLVTAAVVSFVWKARPEIIEKYSLKQPLGNVSIKKVFIMIITSVIIVGGILSSFASSNPDGLEWAMIKTAGTSELKTTGSVHAKLAEIQNKVAFLPDYSFKASEAIDKKESEEKEEVVAGINAQTSVSGILGGIMTLVLAALTGLVITFFRRRKRKAKPI